MPERRLRTAQRKKRARAKVIERYSEAIKLALIGGGVVIIAVFLAKKMLG